MGSKGRTFAGNCVRVILEITKESGPKDICQVRLGREQEDFADRAVWQGGVEGGGSLHIFKVRESWQAVADFNIWPTEPPNTTLSLLNFLCCWVRLVDRIDVVSFRVSYSPISSM